MGKPQGFLAWFGILCSSWIATSRGTTHRSYVCPHGYIEYRSVSEGNVMAARFFVCKTFITCREGLQGILRLAGKTWLRLRCARMCLLVVALGGNFVVEQPKSSLLFRHERMQWLCTKLKASGTKSCLGVCQQSPWFANIALMQVYRVSIWMGKFLSATPKPTLLWSSTSAISGFWSCRKFSLKKFKAKAEHRPSLKPTIQYRDKAGRKRWQGTSDLTKTQILGITMCDCCSNPSVS